MIILSAGEPAAVLVLRQLRAKQNGCTSPSRIRENGHSQEKAPGITPENLASPGSHGAELTPENMELRASYSCPGGRAAATRPVVTSGTYL